MLENSPDLLGEQMQIHELTRRKTNEGIAGALASNITKGLMTKALGQDVSVNSQGLNARGSATDRAGAFGQTAEIAKTLALTLQKAWAQQVQKFMANSTDSQGNPATSLSTITQPSISELQKQLRVMVNQAISPRGGTAFDYGKLDQYAGKDPIEVESARKIIPNIETYVGQIWKSTLDAAKPEVIGSLWQKLAATGIAPAMNIMKFSQAGGGNQAIPQGHASIRPNPQGNGKYEINFGSGWVALDPQNQQHKDYLASMLAGKAA